MAPATLKTDHSQPTKKKSTIMVRGLDGPLLIVVDGIITYLKEVQLTLRFEHNTTTRLLHFPFD